MLNNFGTYLKGDYDWLKFFWEKCGKFFRTPCKNSWKSHSVPKKA